MIRIRTTDPSTGEPLGAWAYEAHNEAVCQVGPVIVAEVIAVQLLDFLPGGAWDRAQITLSWQGTDAYIDTRNRKLTRSLLRMSPGPVCFHLYEDGSVGVSRE